MRITIEPSVRHDGIMPNRVMIETPSDDLEVDEALDTVKLALAAWGYSWESLFEVEAPRAD